MIAAIHGGDIEPHTSEIARSVADNAHGLYLFEGHLGYGDSFKALHVDSRKFDEPLFKERVVSHDTVVSIHGCLDQQLLAIFLGGRNHQLKETVGRCIEDAGFTAVRNGHIYEGTSPANICNHGRLNAGVQVEIPQRYRDDPRARARISRAIATALNLSS
jgi:phage replication-related protein YjqB (UPF0714/DUF867 family)